jgi:hypothetical protein
MREILNPMLLEHQTNLTIKLDYKDILEKEYHVMQIIDVTKELKQR